MKEQEPDLSEFDAEEAGLLLDLDGFEGPLHLLLALARAQKVDLAKISVSALADQYLDFVREARERRIDLAADYLVMASWLAFLKSRLLLPKPAKAEEEPDAAALEAHLRKRLKLLEEARAAAQRLMSLPQWGREVFGRGDPQIVNVVGRPVWRASLHDLLSAYARQRVAAVNRVHAVRPRRAYPIEDARKRLETLLARELGEWRRIETLAPQHGRGENDPTDASYVASLLGAALELVRDGRLEARQNAPFAPLLLKARPA